MPTASLAENRRPRLAALLFRLLAGLECGVAAGALFGLLADPSSGRRTLARALLYVGLLHGFESYFLWPSMGLFAALWFPWGVTLPADLILLLALARFTLFYGRLKEAGG